MIGQSESVVRNVRQEVVVLARLRIGHTRITHSYILKREEQPYCFGCDAPFTVRHFLLKRDDFSHISVVKLQLIIIIIIKNTLLS